MWSLENGMFSEELLSRWDGRLLVSVDSWRQAAVHPDDELHVRPDTQHVDIMKTAATRLGKYGDRSMMLRASSPVAARMFPPGFFDFVYIDASHSADAAMADIMAWWPLVRSGGLFAGHDYFDQLPAFGVKKAVDFFFGDLCRPVHVTRDLPWPSWHVLKP